VEINRARYAAFPDVVRKRGDPGSFPVVIKLTREGSGLSLRSVAWRD
jgi:hypothetical protein